MLYVFWFRKDLRTKDNNALSEFIKEIKMKFKEGKDSFTLLYIKNTNQNSYSGEKRLIFLDQCLSELKNNLEESGLHLNIIFGKSEDVFKNLSRNFKLKVFANSQVEPYTKKRDEKVKEIIKLAGGELLLFDDTTLMKFGGLLKDDGTPYTVFTPFKKKFLNLLTEENYSERKCDLKVLKKFEQYRLNAEKEYIFKSGNPESRFKGGNTEAEKSLKEFIKNGIISYKEKRDFPAVKGTSEISPHLHFGTLSIRECFRVAFDIVEKEKDKTGTETWISELIWREFYYQITYNFPYIINGAFKKEYNNINWENDDVKFRKWCEGMTGYPIVDAGMRQLVKEGWMHNRVRMITAMFLTKDLLIDWKWGEKFFAEHLIDLDFASNNGGWQWSASTGCDAQPYFRIFNPYLQSAKFDSEGIYIRKYIPELKNVPSEYIHRPTDMTPIEQKSFNCIIGKDYPEPIVDHFRMKELAIGLFKIYK